MGWTFTIKRGTVQEFFAQEFNYDKGDGRSGKVLRCHATWTTAYMAYEVKVPAMEGKPAKTDVIGLVCLIRHVPRAADGFTFGYKDMSEDMGPNESKCPRTILELLTPIESQYANEWRARCWARIHKREKIKVKAGNWVKFAKAIRFVDGEEHDKLCFIKGNRFSAVGLGSPGHYRISDWRDRDFEVIGKDYFFKFKGTIRRTTGESVVWDLGGRFIAPLNPTEMDARKAALAAFPAVTEIKSITFQPVTV